jgi:predicted transcriptional regulator
MKTKTTHKTKKSWALPGEPISISEFKAGIKEAEKGPFMTLDELKKSVEEWKKGQNL